MGERSTDRLQSIAFRLLAAKDPRSMYNFKKSHGGRDPFFSLKSLELTRYGFSRENLKSFRDRYEETAGIEIKRAEKYGIDIIFFDSGLYPPLLREIYDPPDFLYVKGDKDVLKTSMLAVVGSRKGSEYGKQAISAILPDIAGANITIVSGMAYGIDSMSHRAAIDIGGKTIGVNAGGLINIYPAGNAPLTKKILENGCIISEFPLDTTPRPQYFPLRNRIIAGISRAVLVVEAEMKSGSLITARLALEQNRDVFAVPGRINNPLSKGTNYLIQQGAKLITHPEDILVEYGVKIKRERKINLSDLSPRERKLLDLMNENGVNSIDYFIEATGDPVPETISTLMGMVLKNLITDENGGFKRIV